MVVHPLQAQQIARADHRAQEPIGAELVAPSPVAVDDQHRVLELRVGPHAKVRRGLVDHRRVVQTQGVHIARDERDPLVGRLQELDPHLGAPQIHDLADAGFLAVGDRIAERIALRVKAVVAAEVVHDRRDAIHAVRPEVRIDVLLVPHLRRQVPLTGFVRRTGQIEQDR
jgi:hypothetical protein